MRYVALALCLVHFGCALTSKRMSTRELEKWTRHWEGEMDLPSRPITFFNREDNPRPEFCGLSGAFRVVPPGFDGDADLRETWVAYDTSCWWADERSLALHEACHARLRHHAIEFSSDRDEDRAIKEDEVGVCMWAYKEES